MSRSVPEVDLTGSQHMAMGHGQYMGLVDGSMSTLEPQRQMFSTSHNPYMDPSSLFDGNGCGYVKVEETQVVHIQDEPVGACSTDAPPKETLYGYEDGLRHKINVQIEDFRFGLQQTLTEEFHDYYSTVLPPAKCRRCENVTHHHQQPAWSRVEEEACPGDGSSSVPGGRGEGGEGVAVDSGACSSTDSRESETLDQLIDQQLIQLQTQAALITSTLLARPEYAMAQQDHDAAENAESASALSDTD